MAGDEPGIDVPGGLVSNKEGELNGDDGPDAAVTRDKLNQALIQVSLSHPYEG